MSPTDIALLVRTDRARRPGGGRDALSAKAVYGQRMFGSASTFFGDRTRGTPRGHRNNTLRAWESVRIALTPPECWLALTVPAENLNGQYIFISTSIDFILIG
jgi:hypothetical protein